MILRKNKLAAMIAGVFASAACQTAIAEVQYADTVQLTNNNRVDTDLAGNASGVIVWSGHDGADYEIFMNDGVTTTRLTTNAQNDSAPQINSRGDIAWLQYGNVSDGNGGVKSVRRVMLRSNGVERVLFEKGFADGVVNIDINDSGQVVWICRLFGKPTYDVYLYDGNEVKQLTNTSGVEDNIEESNPKINANGEVVWVGAILTPLYTAPYHRVPQVFQYKNGVVTQVTFATSFDRTRPSANFADINDRGEMVWVRNDGAKPKVVRYDGITETVVSDATESVLAPQINNAGDIVWYSLVTGGRYDVIRYADGVRQRLSDVGQHNGALTLAHNGKVGWVSTPSITSVATMAHYVNVWDAGSKVVLDHPKHIAYNLVLADNGDVAFGGLNYVIGANGYSQDIYSSEIFRASPITNHPPVANAGTDQVIECTGEFSGVMLDGSASTDPDNDVLSFNWLGSFGSVTGAKPTLSLGLGSHPITLSVSDAKGASDSDTVNVSVVDTTAPSLSIGSNRSLEATSRDGASYALPIQASDVCSSVTLTKTGVKDVYPMGVSNVSVTAADTTGNSTTQSIVVQVVDTTPPMLTPPDDVTVTATGDNTSVSLGTATATDIFDVTVTNDAPTTFPVGTRTVTWTATDANGNSATAPQGVTVQYGFGGFRSPLQQGGIYKLGRVLPVKVAVMYANGTPVPNAYITLSIFKTVDGEVSGTPLDVTSSSAADVGNTLRYSSSDGLYIYNLNTSSMAKAAYRLFVDLHDGSAPRVIDIALK